MRYHIAILLALCTSGQSHAQPHKQKTPHLTVVIIIDQFAYNYLYKLRSFLTGGIGFLLNNGTVYENAHYQYAMPETSAGHATLQTGTLPKDHGIIANAWYEHGKRVASDDDDTQKACVFGPNNTMQPYGKSGHALMVDGLSDQFMLQNQPDSPHHAISLSLKSRAAIFTAGSLGKPFWFDSKTGMFTSSRAYVKTIPAWIQNFNARVHNRLQEGCVWRLTYPHKAQAYNFYDTQNYPCKNTLIGKKIDVAREAEEPYAAYEATPCANQLLIDLAKQCIDHYCTKKSKTLLWLSLSSLDLLAHEDGPYAKDSIDMIYHIDKQLMPLIQHAMRAVGKNNVLFVLTADHGVMPMQPILQEHKLAHVFRYQISNVITSLNSTIEKTFGIKNLITGYQPPALYLDPTQRKDFDSKQTAEITHAIKEELLAKPGIKNVWTHKELSALCFSPTQEIDSYYKNQLYPGRSGDIIIQLTPYTLISNYACGTSHETPYNYDTHVPLMFYYAKRSKKQKIVKKVYTTQVANSIAQLLNIPKPSASTAEVLPGLFRGH